MEPNGRNDGRRGARLELVPRAEVRGAADSGHPDKTEVVFDFAGLPSLGLCDLSWVLTARLQSPDDRVWVRELPLEAWRTLRWLGLDHLFLVYPGAHGQLN